MFIYYEPEMPEPTLLLACPACHAQIAFYGDGSENVHEHIFTLGEYDLVTCECDVMFGDGDELEVIEL